MNQHDRLFRDCQPRIFECHQPWWHYMLIGASVVGLALATIGLFRGWY